MAAPRVMRPASCAGSTNWWSMGSRLLIAQTFIQAWSDSTWCSFTGGTTKYRLIIGESGGWQAFQQLLTLLTEIGDRYPPPDGDMYDLERDDSGPHSRIIKTNLQDIEA
jgi:hypothetical protein